MNIETWRSAVVTAARCARELAKHDLNGLIAAAERADAIGPLVDPTLYREKADKMHEDVELLRAAAALARLANPGG